MRLRGFGVGLSALMAMGCGQKETTSIYESANLEQAMVLFEQEFEGGRRDLSGDLTVDGAGADWTIQVASLPIDVHSPTSADLSSLDGLTQARVALALESISGELSLQITDAEGALRYLLEPVEPGPLTTEAFGLGAVAQANTLGTLQQGVYKVTLVSAWLRTDTGDTELLPGEPQQITLDGANFRAVLLSGFTTEIQDDGALLCDGAASRLAFELTRIEDGAAADLSALTRAPEQALPVGTCSDAPVLPQ